MKADNRLLDHMRVDVLRDKKGGSLFGIILLQLELVWSDLTPVASVGSRTIRLNPAIIGGLEPEVRTTLLVHELQHVARMHRSRRRDRDYRLWNIACDYRINNDMVIDGYSFKGLEFGCFDTRFQSNTEEEIYDILVSEGYLDHLPESDDYDISDEDSDPTWEIQVTQNGILREGTINTGWGCNTQSTKELIEKLLTPQVDWKKVLQNKLTEYGGDVRSYGRRKRGQYDLILPGIVKDIEGSLQAFTAYIDTSSSVTTMMAAQILTELYSVKSMYPEVVIRLVQFDTKIHSSDTIELASELSSFELIGRGGTDLQCVVDDLVETKPTFAMIFSDLLVHSVNLDEVTSDLIWIIIGKRTHFNPPKGGKWNINC